VSYLVGQSALPSWHGGQVYSLSRNLRVRWGGNRLSMPLVPHLGQIKRVLAEKQFDVVHVQVPYSPFMAQPVIHKLQPQTALVGTFHVYPAHKLAIVGSKALKILYGRSLRRFDAQLSVSSAAQAFAKAAYGIDSVVSPNVVDLARFKTAETAERDNRQRIVFLGRLVERKGGQQLLAAFARLRQNHPQVELVIAGDGPQRTQLEKFVKQNKLKKSVRFLGYVSEADKPAILASADIACFPSLYGESFGIVLIEAMASGAGVVLGGNNPGYASVLEDQPQLLVDPKNAADFASRLEKLLSNNTLRQRLHDWQQTAVKKYDVRTVGPQVLAVYRQVIAKRRASRHN